MNNAGSVLNSALLNPVMASFPAQAALRAKWSSLVEDHSIDVPAEVTNKVTSVVGWLKQVYSFNVCVYGSHFCSLHELLFYTQSQCFYFARYVNFILLFFCKLICLSINNAIHRQVTALWFCILSYVINGNTGNTKMTELYKFDNRFKNVYYIKFLRELKNT